MTRRYSLVAAAFVLALALAALWWWSRQERGPASADSPSPAVSPAQSPAAEAPPPPVTVVRAQGGGVGNALPLTATVTTERSAALSPRVSGLVAAVHVDAGDRVAAGKVLLELDPAMARLALQRSEAALEEAEAAHAEARRQYEETQELVDRRLVPTTRLPAAEAAMRMASAAFERLRSEHRQQAETLRRHTVVAPFAGVVSRKIAEVGEWVETGTAVLELVDTQHVRIDVQVPQEHYQNVRIGTPVAVRLDAAPDDVLDGRVSMKVPVKDPEARTFLARIDVPDGHEHMTPGMSARVSFDLGSSVQSVSLPRDALVRQPDGSSLVWVVQGEGTQATVAPRQVQVGRSLGEEVEIRRGVEAGALVVLRGNETLEDGQRVRIVTAAAMAGN